MQIRLRHGPRRTYLNGADDGRTILIQSDWDYAGLASTFGYVPCWCGDTDGTVDCPHKTASEMIMEARQWLDDHLCEKVDDPGYFQPLLPALRWEHFGRAIHHSRLASKQLNFLVHSLVVDMRQCYCYAVWLAMTGSRHWRRKFLPTSGNCRFPFPIDCRNSWAIQAMHGSLPFIGNKWVMRSCSMMVNQREQGSGIHSSV